jgi:hypothetical protein
MITGKDPHTLTNGYRISNKDMMISLTHIHFPFNVPNDMLYVAYNGQKVPDLDGEMMLRPSWRDAMRDY